MKIISEKISLEEIKIMGRAGFGQMVKAVADIGRDIMAIDAEFHSDLEKLLLTDGSKQEDLWGINLYPGETGNDFLEYDSMINLRPGYGNKTRSVDDPNTRKKINKVVYSLIKK